LNATQGGPANSPAPDDLAQALVAYEHDRMSGGALCTIFRGGAAAWPALPPKFLTVLEQLLQPLESSALFSEESCAFSRLDLAASLRQWLQAALIRAPWPAESQAMGGTTPSQPGHRAGP
jgi:hypothetical protein